MEIFGQIGIVICLSILSAIFYRAGGQSQDDTAEPKWIPKWMRHSWVRDWLCPLFVLGCFSIFASPLSYLGWIGVLVSYGLLGGALTTYWDNLFGFDNFWFAGFVCGLAAFPLMFADLQWQFILARAILMALGWGLWCKYQSVDYVEEYGRGAMLVLFVPILLI